MLFLGTPAVEARSTHLYAVAANMNDDKLLLVDQYQQTYVVEAMTYCFDYQGFDRGDVIISTKDLGACATSTLISRRTGESCEVFCP